MGVGGRQPQGLWITTRRVVYVPATHDLTRISEVGVITQFGYNTFAPAAQVIRQFGLKIGILFAPGTQVGKLGNPNGSIEFTAARAGANVSPSSWIVLPEDPAVTAQVGAVFTGAGSKGYRILPNQIPDNTAGPSPWPDALDRLFFRIVVRNFTPHHVKDVQVVPMVCTLNSVPDFQQHYVLGVGVFSVGHGGNGLEFDSQIITRERGMRPVTHATARAAAAPAKKARRPARGGGGRPAPKRRR